MRVEKHSIVVIGRGPAGYTAAIYAARANLKPVIFTGLQPGGQLTITTDVENYPGFPTGILGPELMELFRAQAERVGTQIIDEMVTRVVLRERPFLIEAGKRQMHAEAGIRATGASGKWRGISREKERRGHQGPAASACSRGSWRWTRSATSRSSWAPPGPACLACSRPATRPILPIARPSPPPAPAAWPPSTPNDGSPREASTETPDLGF